MHSRAFLAFGAAFGLLACGCGGAQPGQLSVLIEPEKTIVDGLSAGDGPDEIRDGWAVTFERYVATVGHVELRQNGQTILSNTTSFAIDLTGISPQGERLTDFESISQGRYDFFYKLAHSKPKAHSTVSADNLAELIQAGATYSIAGTLDKANGISCPPAALAVPPDNAAVVAAGRLGEPCYAAPLVRFEFLATADADLGPCEIDGSPGVTVTAGHQTTTAITIHGDHLFFNGFPEAGEGGALRLAQWLADCDLNVDGTVTASELTQIEPGDLAELDERFKLGGSPLVPLDNMLTYVRAQLMTQGHFQGEGDCALASPTGL